MSLFGGDGSVPPSQSPYETESENPPSIASSPSLPELGNDSDTQLAQLTTYPPDWDLDEDDDLESETGLESDDGEEPERPNRFTGKPQTWKGYTLADRQIAASLDQIQDSDLAAHLYNAHALKRRVQRPKEQISQLENWQNKGSWLKKGEELEFTDAFGETKTELVPSRDWTAWPLPFSRTSIFKAAETRAVSGNEDYWTIGCASQQDQGQVLREEMLAVVLRLAKEKWNSREPGKDAHGEKSRVRQTPADDSDQSRTSGNKSGHPKSDVEMYTSGTSGIDSEGNPLTGRKRGRKPRPQVTLKPVFLADDMKAHQIMQPAINSMLTQLDDVALAIRRSRQNHFGRGADSDRSESDFTSDVESLAPGSRPASDSSSRRTKKQSTSRPSSRQALKRKKDLKQQDQAPPDSDSASDYGVEYERKHGAQSRQSKRSRSKSLEDGESSATDRDWSNRVGGLLDWSEVLGIAAVKGWNEKALARTAQRCVSLFGERMSFIPFGQNASVQSVPEPVHYTPSTVPDLNVPEIVGQEEQKRPLFDVGTLRCPHADCWGNAKEFEKPYRVIEHCLRVHGYDPRTNDSDNEERTVGGVHIDGFMRPITAKVGWLGQGRSKSRTGTGKVEGGTSGKRRKKQKVNEPLNLDEFLDST